MKNTLHRKPGKNRCIRRDLGIISLGLVLLLSGTACEDDLGNNESPVPNASDWTGSWEVLEKTGFSAPQVYTLRISEGNSSSEVILEGLYNISSVRLEASVDEFELTIPAQSSEGISFVGTGSAAVAFDQITLNFEANDGSGADVVEAVLTR